MNRFEFALQAANAPHAVPLSQIAQEFNDAVVQCEAEGLRADEDPAVLLMGAFIAFITHADVCMMDGYGKMMAMCEDRLATPLVAH